MIMDSQWTFRSYKHFFHKCYSFSYQYPIQCAILFIEISFDNVELIYFVCHVWRLCQLLLPQGTLLKIFEKYGMMF